MFCVARYFASTVVGGVLELVVPFADVLSTAVSANTSLNSVGGTWRFMKNRFKKNHMQGLILDMSDTSVRHCSFVEKGAISLTK